MRPGSASLASSLALLAACAAAPPSPPASPSPPPASPDAPPAVVAAEPAVDPTIVRCGVDDRPRSVVSSLDVARSERARGLAMKPAFEAPFPPQGGRAGTAPVAGPLTPRVSAIVDKEAVTFATMPDLDACEGLATAADEASLRFPVELSSDGAPRRVRPPATTVSPYVRCVQERLCGLAGGPASQAVSVPVSIKWNYARRRAPRAAPVGAVDAPRVTFEHDPPESHARHAYARTLKALAHHAAALCGASGTDVSLILTLTLDKQLKVAAARAAATGPELQPHVATCVADRMKGESLPTPPEPRPSGDVVLVLDW